MLWKKRSRKTEAGAGVSEEEHWEADSGDVLCQTGGWTSDSKL